MSIACMPPWAHQCFSRGDTRSGTVGLEGMDIQKLYRYCQIALQCGCVSQPSYQQCLFLRLLKTRTKTLLFLITRVSQYERINALKSISMYIFTSEEEGQEREDTGWRTTRSLRKCQGRSRACVKGLVLDGRRAPVLMSFAGVSFLWLYATESKVQGLRWGTEEGGRILKYRENEKAGDQDNVSQRKMVLKKVVKIFRKFCVLNPAFIWIF